jgi:hypothetical protein
MKLDSVSRRSLGVALAAALAAPAQTPPSDLDQAKERLRQNAAALTKTPLDRSTEPAFFFQA